jgi:RNA polymerase sigma factor (sigma-70 family)
MTENGYNVQIQVRNNHILKRIRDQYGSSAKMCKETGLVATAVSALLCFREKPFLMDGSLSTAASGLCSALGATPEELWPDEMSEIVARKATYELELSQAQALSLCSSAEEDIIARQLIEKWSECLSDRQRIALEVLCWGHNTRSKLAKRLGVSRERVRQLQQRALNKMRHRAIVDDNVRSYWEALGQ